MKKIVQRLLTIIVAVLIIIGLLSYLEKTLVIKNSDAKYHDFFEEDKDFDILFLGTSHVIDAVYPLEIWDDQGYTSYNMGGHSTPIATQYWVLKNSLDYTRPKMVVVDCYSLMDNIKVSDNFDYAHISMDCFSLSPTKVKATFDLMDGDSEHSALDLLWPFSIYHNRWTELTDKDFNVEYNRLKGAERLIHVEKPDEYIPIDKNLVLTEDTVAIHYLNRIIEECQSRGIEVLLVYLPFVAADYRQMEANTVYSIAEKYGVNYINFLDMELVDFYTDLEDTGAHLNPAGGNKVTHYIGEYIANNYNLVNHHGDPAYADWDEDLAVYLNNKKDDFIYNTDPYEYMMMLCDNDIFVEMELYDSVIYVDPISVKMLKSIGCYTENVTERPDKFDDNVCAALKVYDAKTGDLIETGLLSVTYQIELTKFYE